MNVIVEESVRLRMFNIEFFFKCLVGCSVNILCWEFQLFLFHTVFTKPLNLFAKSNQLEALIIGLSSGERQKNSKEEFLQYLAFFELWNISKFEYKKKQIIFDSATQKFNYWAGITEACLKVLSNLEEDLSLELKSSSEVKKVYNVTSNNEPFKVGFSNKDSNFSFTKQSNLTKRNVYSDTVVVTEIKPHNKIAEEKMENHKKDVLLKRVPILRNDLFKEKKNAGMDDMSVANLGLSM
ncbi:hypothetical protein HDU92_002401 [Lobulomyces angularis]|nr:hypothetical protein HDU92_002401 [Lobulomyces angularis]